MSGPARARVEKVPPPNPECQGFGFEGMALDKELEVAGRTFAETGPDGKPDLEHMITRRWFCAFKVRPPRPQQK